MSTLEQHATPTPTPTPAPTPRRRSRPVWPAYAVAGAALFTALNGPAYAAGLITGADIKDGTVASADLKNDSVKGGDVKDGTLASKDLSSAARSELSGTVGACGPDEELMWLPVGLMSDGSMVDQSLRIGRCIAPGTGSVGDGLLQGLEECDDANNHAGDGCSPIGTLEGVLTIKLFPNR